MFIFIFFLFLFLFIFFFFFFFFNDTATTEIYTLSLHDALPILKAKAKKPDTSVKQRQTLGVLLIMCAILITLSVISYSPLDAPQAETNMGDLPAVFTRSDPVVNAHADTVQNWLGLIGSMMADFFINKTIGYAAIIFPLLLGAWSLAFFKFTTRQRRK